MTREEKIALCRKLRDEEGLTVQAIAARVGIARSTVGDYLLGDDHRRRRDFVPCTCGRPMFRRSTECRVCWGERWKAQRRLIERLWAEGKTGPEITAALGWNADNLGSLADAMRQEGYNLPYRYTTGKRAGRKFPEQVAA